MKKLFILPVLSLLALTGCNVGGEESGGGTSATPEDLVGDEETAKAKIIELGKTSGFEITFTTTDADSMTVGRKQDYYWIESEDTKILMKQNEGSVSYYTEYTDGVYSNPITRQDDYIEMSFDGYATQFCCAYTTSLGGSYYKVGEVSYLGRSAIEYRYEYRFINESASAKIVIDKETNITLCWVASASDGTTIETGGYEVTQFKVGDAAIVPAHTE